MALDYREVIKNSISQEKLRKSRARRREVEELLNFYTGTNTEFYIEDFFSPDIYSDIPIYKMNITKKFIDKMSRVYVPKAVRKISGQENLLYSSLTPNKNVRMKHVERMTNLLGTPALRIVWNDYDKDTSFFEYKPIYYFDAHFDDFNPYKPVSIMYPVLNPTYDISYSENLQWEYWDSEKYCRYDEKGNIIFEEVNPYGIIPFVFPRDMEQIDDFINEGATDIVNVNKHINITMTNLQLGLHYQMVGQPYATGVYADEPIKRVGPDYIINVPEGGTFGIASPQGDLKGVVDTIKFQLEMLAQSRHMSINFDSNQDRPSSGIALVIKDFEHMTDYQDDMERYRELEHDIFNIERTIASVNEVDIKDSFEIEFGELEYPRTTQELIAKEQYEIEKGFTTDAELLQKRKGDITLEEAKKIIEENSSNG
tara:strand:+ start:5147 stop:6424 length:1278 start_codon:yes stop_codon:yes gene_type:complete